MPRTKRKQPTRTIENRQRTAIYCRVSTRGQGESGLSLDHQRDRCRKYCESKALEVTNVYQDVASGKDLDRPAMQEMLLSASRKEIDTIVSLKLDRLSRVPRDFYNLFQELENQNIALSVVEESLDTSTAAGRMIVGILLQFASFERELGIERTRAAVRQIALQGRPGGGVPPLGYDRIEKEFILNKTEANIIELIFSLYLRGLGPTKISKTLNEMGYVTKVHKRKGGDQVGGQPFTKKNIHNIITNPIYKGILFFRGELLKGK